MHELTDALVGNTLSLAQGTPKTRGCALVTDPAPEATVSFFKATEKISQVQDKATHTKKMLDENKRYLSYGEYAKFRGKILK